MTKADENLLPGKVKPKAKATSGEKIKGLDLTVATITDALRDQYDLQDTDKGVVILAVGKGSVAAEKGLLPGMIIQSVTQQAVASPKDVQKAVDAAQKAGRPSVLLQIRRGERERFIALKLSD
jgi:serine protease Do